MTLIILLLFTAPSSSSSVYYELSQESNQTEHAGGHAETSLGGRAGEGLDWTVVAGLASGVVDGRGRVERAGSCLTGHGRGCCRCCRGRGANISSSSASLPSSWWCGQGLSRYETNDLSGCRSGSGRTRSRSCLRCSGCFRNSVEDDLWDCHHLCRHAARSERPCECDDCTWHLGRGSSWRWGLSLTTRDWGRWSGWCRWCWD